MRLLALFTPATLLAAALAGPAAAADDTALPLSFNGLSGYFHSFPDWAPPNPDYRHDGWGVSYYTSVHPVKPDVDDWTQLGTTTWTTPNRYEDADGNTSPYPDEEHFCSPGSTVPSMLASIEGGIGTWGSVAYPTDRPMFMVAATGDCYNHMHGGPAYLAGGNAVLEPEDLYFAQLSNRLLLPPTPLLFEMPAEPELFGMGWIALPIIPANASPYGIPTGPNNWTLFINSANFKGPVGFFTPAFWTALAHDPANSGDSVGYGLDVRNGVSGLAALEVGFTPSFNATDAQGDEYRRVPRLTFAADANRRAVLLQDFRRYGKTALWDGVAGWIDGGEAPAGIHQPGVWNSTFADLTELMTMLDPDRTPVHYGATVQATQFTTAGGGAVFGLQWDGSLESGVLPEYYRKVDGTWRPVAKAEVPAETRLTEQTFPKMEAQGTPPLDIGPGSPWAKSTWAAGPFRAALGSDTVVDYVWYRFTDQPAIARLPLAPAMRAKLQTWAESVHQAGVDGLTIAPPSSGALATLDPAQIVTPPAGMETGYVPIAIAQWPERIFASGFE